MRRWADAVNTGTPDGKENDYSHKNKQTVRQTDRQTDKQL